jgi:hypothetical protein
MPAAPENVALSDDVIFAGFQFEPKLKSVVPGVQTLLAASAEPATATIKKATKQLRERYFLFMVLLGRGSDAAFIDQLA